MPYNVIDRFCKGGYKIIELRNVLFGIIFLFFITISLLSWLNNNNNNENNFLCVLVLLIPFIVFSHQFNLNFPEWWTEMNKIWYKCTHRRTYFCIYAPSSSRLAFSIYLNTHISNLEQIFFYIRFYFHEFLLLLSCWYKSVLLNLLTEICSIACKNVNADCMCK